MGLYESYFHHLCFCRGANAICVGDVFREANTLRTPCVRPVRTPLAMLYGYNLT